MDNLEKRATATTGDFGPQGVNIRHHWVGEDRIMLVAVKKTASSNNNTNDDSQQRVIGCCCIKRGDSESIIAPSECTEYSLYRLSVAEDARGMGAGQQLLNECESWAKQRGATLISLISPNAKSGEFYCKRGYVRNGMAGYVKTI